MRDRREILVVLGMLTVAVGVATATAVAVETPSPTPTPSTTCVNTPLIPPYCADHCTPCPTSRAGCFTQACVECIENPICVSGETCVPHGFLEGCCSCATQTPTPIEGTCGDVCDDRACGSFTCPGGQPQTRFCSVVGPGGNRQCSPIECPTAPATPTCTPQSINTCRQDQTITCTDLGDHCVVCACVTNTPTPSATSTCDSCARIGTATRTPTRPPTCACTPTTTATVPTRTHTPPRLPCIGDCNGDGAVRINELITGVSIALNGAPASACPALDCEGSLFVRVNCLISAVGNALHGCRVPTATSTPQATYTASPIEIGDTCCEPSETTCSEPPPHAICRFAPVPGRGYPSPYECAPSGRCELPHPTPSPMQMPPSPPMTRRPPTATPSRTPTVPRPTRTATPTPRSALQCSGCNSDGLCSLTIEGEPYPGECIETGAGQECGCRARLDTCGRDACDGGPNCLTSSLNGLPALGRCHTCECVPLNCGLVENVGGCCDFSLGAPENQKPCSGLQRGQDAALCRSAGGYPVGCRGSVTCNQSTGACEARF